MQNLNELVLEIPELKASISRTYHRETKIKKLSVPLDPKKWPTTWTTIDFKAYPRYPYLPLPKPKLNSHLSLKKILLNRHSSRLFNNKPLRLSTLSSLLFYSSGIKGETYVKGGERFYPSAGARYPLELYPLVLKLDDLTTGVYHYYVKKHGLEELFVGKKMKKKILQNFNSEWTHKSSVILVISAIFYRNQIKYYERGYRHILSEVGFLSENIYLVAEALGINCCSLGGYFDDGLNKLIDLEEDVESVVGAVALGERR